MSKYNSDMSAIYSLENITSWVYGIRHLCEYEKLVIYDPVMVEDKVLLELNETQ